MGLRIKWSGTAAVFGAGVMLATGLATPAHAAGEATWYRNVQTGRCLDSNPSGKVYTSPCADKYNFYRQWQRTVVNGKIRLKNMATNRCLTLNDSWSEIVRTDPCGIDDNELWWELRVNGTTRIVNPDSKALDSDKKGNAYAKDYGADNPYQQWNELVPQ
ncbi:RICIN domain-containing protein [Streptomyces sp. NPDC051555]|uniref:RICIN domain-containing protein n=1 Tax=Streptomyces sp. NPDC051555 TaxID=3365657 RepID=UPI0037B28C58